MKLKVPKTERRKNRDSKGRRIFRGFLIGLVTLIVVGLCGLHLAGVDYCCPPVVLEYGE